jgi:hypothetical protein
LKQLGFDHIWLMGVWKRSKRGAHVSASLPYLEEEYAKALPGWRRSDVAGSPYAVASYTLSPELGSSEDLTLLRGILHDVGLGLILESPIQVNSHFLPATPMRIPV